MQKIRIFISSPSDLTPERLTTVQVIERLHNEFKHFFDVSPVFWEHEPLLATEHFQEGLVSPGDCDLMVCMLWSTLGSPLPEQFNAKNTDKSVTGTEWEFEKAQEYFEKQGHPRIIFYRKSASVTVDINDVDAIEKAQKNKAALDHFFNKHFHNQDDANTFKKAYWPFEGLDDFESQLETHLRNLLKELAGENRNQGTSQEITWHKGSPFRGLRAFELEHAAIFFGRSRARSQIFEQFQQQIKAQKAFLMVLGMSGSGKSSLVKAAVQPLLLSPKVIDGVAECRWIQFKPSDSPNDLVFGLARALFHQAGLPEAAPDESAQKTILKQVEQSPHALETIIFSTLNFIKQAKQYREQYQVKLLIIIDQFEELFTLPDISETDRKALISLLHSLVSSGHSYVICTMRSDFFAQCEPYPELIELMKGNGQYHLAPPTGEEIEQMIVHPARAAGINFAQNEDGVSLAQIIRERSAQHPSALPLLSFTLDELYRRRDDKGLLTFKSYDELGGLEGAIATRAEDVFNQLDDAEQDAFKEILPSLVTIHSEDSDTVTARSVAWSFVEQDPIRKRLVETLINERLLVSQTQVNAPTNTTVRFTHEALLQNWKRVKEWVEFNLEQLKTRARLASHARYWEMSNKQEDELLSEGIFFQQVLELSHTEKVDLSQLETSFIDASNIKVMALTRARKAKQEKDEQFKKKLSWAAIAASVFLLIFFYQLYSNQQAKNALEAVRFTQSMNQQENINGQIVRRVQQELDQGNNVDALKLALRAKPVENYSVNYGQSRQVLYKALNQYPLISTISNQYKQIGKLSILISQTKGHLPIVSKTAKTFYPYNSFFKQNDFENLNYFADTNSSTILAYNEVNNYLEAWSIDKELMDWRWQSESKIESWIYKGSSKQWLVLLTTGEIYSLSNISGKAKLIVNTQLDKNAKHQFKSIAYSDSIAIITKQENKVSAVRIMQNTENIIQLESMTDNNDHPINLNWDSPIEVNSLEGRTLVITDAKGKTDLYDESSGDFINRLSNKSLIKPIYLKDKLMYVDDEGDAFLWTADNLNQSYQLPLKGYQYAIAATQKMTLQDDSQSSDSSKLTSKSYQEKASAIKRKMQQNDINSTESSRLTHQKIYFIDYQGALVSTLLSETPFTYTVELANVTSSADLPQVYPLKKGREILIYIPNDKLLIYDTITKQRKWQIQLSQSEDSTYDDKITFNDEFLVLNVKANSPKDLLIDLNFGNQFLIEKNINDLSVYDLDAKVGFYQGADNKLKRLNLKSKKSEFTHQLSKSITSLEILPEGGLLTGKENEQVDLWQTTVSKSKFNQIVDAKTSSFDVSKNVTWAISAQENHLNYINLATGKNVYQFDIPGKATGVSLAQNGLDAFVMIENQDFYFFNLNEHKLKHLFHTKYKVEQFYILGNIGKVALRLADENNIELRELSSGKLTQELTHWSKPVDIFVDKNDNNLLVSLTEDNTFNFWDLNNGNFLKRVPLSGHIDKASIFNNTITFISRYSLNSTEIYDPVGDVSLGQIPFSPSDILSYKVNLSASQVAIHLNSKALKILPISQSNLNSPSLTSDIEANVPTFNGVFDFIFSASGESVIYLNKENVLFEVNLEDMTSEIISKFSAKKSFSLKGITVDDQFLVINIKNEKSSSTEQFTIGYFDIENAKGVSEINDLEVVDGYIEHLELISLKGISLGRLKLSDKVPDIQQLSNTYLKRNIIDINAPNQLVVTRSKDNIIAVWNIMTNQLIAEIPMDRVNFGAYLTDDGKTLIVHGNGKIATQRIYPEPIETFIKNRLLN